MRRFDLLGRAGAVLRHLDLRQTALAAFHVVTALADITNHTGIFHFHLTSLFGMFLGCPISKRLCSFIFCLGFPFCFQDDRRTLDGQNRMDRQRAVVFPVLCRSVYQEQTLTMRPDQHPACGKQPVRRRPGSRCRSGLPR